MISKKALILGATGYAKELSLWLKNYYEVSIVENNISKINTYDLKDINLIEKDALSLSFWVDDLDLQNVELIVSLLDEKQSYSLISYLRDTLSYKNKIVLVSKKTIYEKDFSKYNVHVINISELILSVFKNKIKDSSFVSYPLAEQINNLNFAIVDIPDYIVGANTILKDFWNKNINICGIIRDDSFILPTINLKIKPKDKILVMGESKFVEDFISFITGGIPNFPSRWGHKSVLLTNKELGFLKRLRINKYINLSLKEIKEEKDIGLIVFENKKYLKELIFNFSVPSLFLKSFKELKDIKEALLYLDIKNYFSHLIYSLDFVKTLNANLTVCFVVSSKKLRSLEEEKNLEDIKKL